MSRYAWLVCEDTKQVIWLGKICVDPSSKDVYFHVGESTSPTNSANHLLMKAIMKFLATNMSKTLRVWPEEMFDANIDDQFTIIAMDGNESISIDRYIQDFPG